MATRTSLKATIVTLLFVLVVGAPVAAGGQIIYVDDDGPADFSNIQAAIDNSNHGDTIVINPGTYTGDGNRDIDFKGKAITVRSTDPNDPNIVAATIIDCNHLGRGFLFHSGEDGNSILSGFTIMNGQAAIGAGIYCKNQSGPTISNCVIKSNRADGQESTGFGGGISGCKGTIINCTIRGNKAVGKSYGSGGGLYDCNGKITNCTISYNTIGPAGDGGGLSECNGDIINCTISNNWLEGYVGWRGRGGGLYSCNGAIINSTISGNVIVAVQEAYGGGLYECNGPIINCTIKGNWVRCDYHVSAGGGLYHCDGPIINCTIRGNTTATSYGIEAMGGGLYACDGTISNCTISHNSAEGGSEYDDGSWGLGGGLYGCNGKIINCVISDNTATVTDRLENSGGAGGGLYRCSGTITNCTIIGNTASDRGWYDQRSFGGGLCGCDGTISNCTISGNITLSKYDSAGGGLCGCDGTIINCTISGNTAMLEDEPTVGDATGGGLYRCKGTITNCIIWANSANTGSQVYSSSEPDYCCVQDYTGSGTGNIGDDPLFIDPNNVDYHLFPSSPCIDAGDPNYAAEPNETDLDGNPRVIGCRIDMGAYESPIFAKVRIVPQTINLASKGNWITCYFWLPEQYNVADVEPNSIFLEDIIQSEQFSVDEQQQVATARFNREDVQPILDLGDIDLTITGQLTDGTVFEATDTIKVLNKIGRKSPN